jgi:hypothetical protein
MSGSFRAGDVDVATAGGARNLIDAVADDEPPPAVAAADPGELGVILARRGRWSGRRGEAPQIGDAERV